MSKRQTNMSARKVIETKSTTAVGDKEFFLAIESAILDGYRICTNYSRADNTSRNHLGFMGRCVLYKNGKEFLDDVPSLTEDSTPEVASKEVEAVTEEKSVDWAELEKLSKKKEVLEWAKTNKFEVPEGLNVPAQIKKHLKDTYQK